ncbi:MAG: VCBS repeat-containing protein, partial [Candidatus Nanoarchaeia archaeon]|nr:VCBS repeat-containing protein [Candidatus Nanoarchaeia archaeon]
KTVQASSPANLNTENSGFVYVCSEYEINCTNTWFNEVNNFNEYTKCGCCGDDLNEYFYNGTIGSTNNFCFNSVVVNEEIDNSSDICLFYNYTWFNNSQNFIRTTYSMSPNPTELSSGDVDSDDDNDVVISGINSWLYIYKNYGNDTFYSQAYSKYVHAIHHLSDLDSDGDMDIAVVRGSTYKDLFFLQNDGNGNYVEINSTTVEGSPLNIKCADIDSDGDKDAIMISYYYFSIHENVNNGFLSNKTYFYDYGGQINSLGLGDVNEDGYIDLMIGRWNQIIIYYNNGSGNFDTNMTINTYSLLGSTHNFHDIYFYDIDKDSYNDILLPLYNSAGLFILYNNGSGYFSDIFYYSLPTTLDDLAIGDIDSDGYDDVSLTGSGWPGFIYIMKNNGTGRNFSLYNTLITGNSPRDIKILDFDNTTTLDIVNANAGSGYSGFNYFSNVITLGSGKYCCGDDGVLDNFTNGTHSCCNGDFRLGSC